MTSAPCWHAESLTFAATIPDPHGFATGRCGDSATLRSEELRTARTCVPMRRPRGKLSDFAAGETAGAARSARPWLFGDPDCVASASECQSSQSHRVIRSARNATPERVGRWHEGWHSPTPPSVVDDRLAAARGFGLAPGFCRSRGYRGSDVRSTRAR
jgi:hypothetical protein